MEIQQARLHNASQPLQKLPDEILSVIFECGAPSPWPSSPSWSPKEYDVHLQSIGSTCARFRAVLLDSPRCWTSVEVLIEEQPQESLDALEADSTGQRTVNLTYTFAVDQ